MAGNIISSMAFLPPTPPSYGKELPGLFFSDGVAIMRYPIDLPHKMTILYSHGNAEDLGFNKDYMNILSDRLRVNMVTYDYEGYGLTPGQPSETGCYRSVVSAYRYLVDTHHVNPMNIIIAGRSLGSGPAIEIASAVKCAGLLLISPLLSALRVVLPDYMAMLLRYSDIFLNLNKISTVTCPVLIIHGFMDDVVPWRHGSELAKKCPNLWRMVTVSQGTHNNRATTLGAVDDIRQFIQYIESQTF